MKGPRREKRRWAELEIQEKIRIGKSSSSECISNSRDIDTSAI